MRAALWTLQIVLAVVFGAAGLMKLVVPIATLAAQDPWIGDAPGLIHFIGVAEIAGAIGVIVPAATRILPLLTPLAAAGLTAIMILATAFNASRGDWWSIALTVPLGALAAFVAWGRFRRAPIASRHRIGASGLAANRG
jgi:uncharacterized membrane protein YphA (DoxX/SURF4 family)